MSRPPRAVITGFGVVSPYGIGRESFSSGLLSGESRTSRVTLFDASDLACQVVAEVPDFRPEDHLDRKDSKRLGRIVPMARLAATEALAHAGFDVDRFTDEMRDHIEVIVGTGGGSIEFTERQYALYYAGDVRRATPYAVASSTAGMLASEISLHLRVFGRSHVLSNGCTSSIDALGYALDRIRSGRAPIVVTGGADACITHGVLSGYLRMGVVPTHWNDDAGEASRPFAPDRDGFVLGEGAWFFVFEDEDHARDREVPILASVVGYGSTCDALHRVAPAGSRDQAARAIRLALDDAALSPDAIDYATLHGTGTEAGDRSEVEALRQVFDAGWTSLPVGAPKAVIGHPQGASGAAGTAAALVALQANALPPVLHLHETDPDLPLDLVRGAPRPARPRHVLVNCMGFGSKNSALVLSRHGWHEGSGW